MTTAGRQAQRTFAASKQPVSDGHKTRGGCVQQQQLVALCSLPCCHTVWLSRLAGNLTQVACRFK